MFIFTLRQIHVYNVISLPITVILVSFLLTPFCSPPLFVYGSLNLVKVGCMDTGRGEELYTTRVFRSTIFELHLDENVRNTMSPPPYITRLSVLCRTSVSLPALDYFSRARRASCPRLSVT